ncbi:hypothetical protein ACU70_25735 [Escherichia coli]|nr:hypothetical protein ACU70_25735 [Escherichia coli]
MNERLKTHSKTQKKSADLVSNKLRIGVFQQYQMKCKSVSKKSPRYTKALHLVDNTDIARVSKRKRELTFNTDFGDLTLFQQAQSGEAK